LGTSIFGTSILDKDTLNAFCRHTHAEVKGAPDGPLAGMTFGVKDIYDIAGVKTGFGNPDWLATHGAAETTAPVVEALLRAGASVVGKTHTEEMAFSINGVNAHYGNPVNVNAPGRVSGGSSSGSAAAVAGGLCDFALGSDTGGSVRLPASYCGLYGLRPTHGRISLEGVRPLAPGFDTVGWFARDMKTFAAVGSVLLPGGASPPDTGELLIADDAFALLAPAAKAALQPAADRIAGLLGSPRPVTVSAEGLREWFETFRVIQFAEIWHAHGDWITKHNPKFGPGIGERIRSTAKSDPGEVAAVKSRRETIAGRMRSLLADNAVLMLPTVPGIAPRFDTPVAEVEDFRGRAMSLLCISGLARLPQITLPLAKLDGCPLGISLIAAPGADEMLIAAASRIAAGLS
jgi:amidase